MVARELYGARGVSYSPKALGIMKRLESEPESRQLGTCIAKTHLSLPPDVSRNRRGHEDGGDHGAILIMGSGEPETRARGWGPAQMLPTRLLVSGSKPVCRRLVPGPNPSLALQAFLTTLPASCLKFQLSAPPRKRSPHSGKKLPATGDLCVTEWGRVVRLSPRNLVSCC